MPLEQTLEDVEFFTALDHLPQFHLEKSVMETDIARWRVHFTATWRPLPIALSSPVLQSFSGRKGEVYFSYHLLVAYSVLFSVPPAIHCIVRFDGVVGRHGKRG
jgi:hypothetical protein